MASIERNSKSKKDGFHESLLVDVLLKVSITEQSYEIMFFHFLSNRSFERLKSISKIYLAVL